MTSVVSLLTDWDYEVVTARDGAAALRRAALAFAQVLIHFGTGSVFYLARRSSGSLVTAMILHALWDFSIFSSTVAYAGLVTPLIGIAAVIVVMVLLRREKRSDLNQTPVLTHRSARWSECATGSIGPQSPSVFTAAGERLAKSHQVTQGFPRAPPIHRCRTIFRRESHNSR
ncbi:hypothetical protein [Arthrobacter zhaoguopingii]|uniref:hypothetical protein n=1 Tax=Arthrobacter zhaoguopingii TaxID=2681491 RepID=UPI00135BAF37|nr:hypothetical protein [Arthrobacter zhaoguopingii]